MSEHSRDDLLDNFYPQASGQWDGFRHVGSGPLGWYNGRSAAEVAPDDGTLGIDKIAEQGIFVRGVLVDMRAYWDASGGDVPVHSTRSIEVADIEAAHERQGSALSTADLLVLRTGWLEQFMSRDEESRVRLMERRSWPGLSASNRWPALPVELPRHRRGCRQPGRRGRSGKSPELLLAPTHSQAARPDDRRAVGSGSPITGLQRAGSLRVPRRLLPVEPPWWTRISGQRHRCTLK